MKPFILAVDVDLTVVDSLTPWMAWFSKETGINFDPTTQSTYDLVPAMKSKLDEAGVINFNPFDYWKKSDLYDDLQPLPGAVEAISYLQRNYDLKLLFVSHCVPSHEDSKIRFLKRCFKDYDFISTRAKGYVDYDLIVDDNIEVLSEAMKIRPNSPHVAFRYFNTGMKLQPGMMTMDHWDQTSRLIEPFVKVGTSQPLVYHDQDLLTA